MTTEAKIAGLTCTDAAEAIAKHLGGEVLSPDLLEQLGEHVQDCDACYECDWITCEQFWKIDQGGAHIEAQPDNTFYYNHLQGCKACRDQYDSRILEAAGVDVASYPCVCSAKATAMICQLHDNPFDCPDVHLIRHEDGSFGIPIRDGGRSVSRIHFCPWCGTKL